MNGEVWRESRGTEEVRAEIEREREERREVESGLARCSVCGGEAKVEEFGLEGNGVWIGCDKTAECRRYIEIHTEGWSIREAAEEWNRYNSGLYLLVRKLKRWISKRVGAERMRELREGRERKREEEAKKARLREVFGLNVGKKEGMISKIKGKLAKRHNKSKI